jgi:hypothetical protein
MKKAYIAGAALVVALMAAFWYLNGGGETPRGQAPLRRITAANAGEFKNEFNRAKTEVRVLLLLSPT